MAVGCASVQQVTLHGRNARLLHGRIRTKTVKQMTARDYSHAGILYLGVGRWKAPSSAAYLPACTTEFCWCHTHTHIAISWPARGNVGTCAL